MTTQEIERKPIALTDSQTKTLIDAYISLSGLRNLLLDAEAYALEGLEESHLNSDVLHMIAVFAGRLGSDLGKIAMSD